MKKKEGAEKIRDITAASNPVIKQSTISLSLRESFQAEHQNQKICSELKRIQAEERLELKMKELSAAGLKMTEPPKIAPREVSFNKYRLPKDETINPRLCKDDEDLSDDPLTDDDDDDSGLIYDE
jgi:hypothetical protein